MNVFVGAPIKNLIELENEEKKEIIKLIKNICVRLDSEEFIVFSAHLIEKFGKSEHLWTSHDICKRDFEWAVECDVYIAIITEVDGKLLNSDGLNIEIGWVSMLRKPIIVICNYSVRNQLSKVMEGLDEITRVRYLDIDKIKKDSNQLISKIKEIINGI